MVSLICGHGWRHLRDNKRRPLSARDYIHLQLGSAFEAHIYSAPLAQIWFDNRWLCISEISAIFDRNQGVVARRDIIKSERAVAIALVAAYEIGTVQILRDEQHHCTGKGLCIFQRNSFDVHQAVRSDKR